MKQYSATSFAYLAVAFLTACAPITWQPPTASTQSFQEERAECLAIGGSGANNQVMPTAGSPGDETGFSQASNQGDVTPAQGEVSSGCISKDWITAVAASIAAHDAKGPKKTATPSLQEVMQQAGFDWHWKPNHGAEVFVNSGSAKRVGAAITAQASAIYPATDLVGCADGNKVTVRWKICNYALPQEGGFLYVNSCTLFYGVKPVCGEDYNPPIKQAFNQASPWAKWLEHHGL